MLEQFWCRLKRREIYVGASIRWRSSQAQLLAARRADDCAHMLTALGLPEGPGALLAEHRQTLDAAYRTVAGRLAVDTASADLIFVCRCPFSQPPNPQCGRRREAGPHQADARHTTANAAHAVWRGAGETVRPQRPGP